MANAGVLFVFTDKEVDDADLQNDINPNIKIRILLEEWSQERRIVKNVGEAELTK